MRLQTFKKNYDVALLKLEATRNEVVIKVLVTEKRTGIYDTFGWTPDCYGAEPYNGSFDEDMDMVVMEYMRDEIWMKLPCPTASESELDMVKKFEII